MKPLKIVDQTLLFFLQLLLISIVLVVTWQVVSRYLLNSPSPFTEELARFQLIWISLLGAAYAYRHNAHLGLDLIYDESSDKIKAILNKLIHGSIFVFSLLALIFGGIALVSMTLTLGQKSAVMGIDIGLVYVVLPITGIWICIYSIAAIFKRSIG